MSPNDPRHGTTAGHAAGCRLACCREARNADERRRRKQRQVLGIHRRIDNTGTVRRIQALWAIGWTSADIATMCGWETPQAVTEVVAARHSVYRETAEAITSAYDVLSMTPGPSATNRRRARRKGWLPPLAWDDIDDPNEQPSLDDDPDAIDEVAVERVMAGDYKQPLTRAEKQEVVRRWVADGRSLNQLEKRAGWGAVRYYKEMEGAA